MTSQISIPKLIKQEIRQNSWMFALSALVQFLAGPVYCLLALNIKLSNHNESVYVLSRLCYFFDEGYLFMQLLVMVITIGFCIFSYRYLFSRRMADLYHSVPITRTKLFLVKYVHGFFVWFLPFAAGTLLVLIISLIRLGYYANLNYAGILVKSWAGSTLLLLFCFFVFYHLFLVAAYLSGNVLNLLTNIVLLGISVACTYALLLCFAEVCFDTFYGSPSPQLLDVLLGLSPLITPFYLYYCVENIGINGLLTGHSTVLVTGIVFSATLLLLSLYLYKRRPSELAEHGTMNKIYRILIRITATFLATLAISLFFSQIVSGSFRILWGIFGAVLGGILCFGALNSIFHTTIKCFFKNLSQMIGITAISTILILAFHLDWFGYDSYLPDKKDIAGVAIYMPSLGDDTSNVYINANSVWVYGSDSHYTVNQEKLLTDKDICYDFLNLVINAEPKDRRYFYAKIQLENGRTYYRQYYINYSDYQALAPFVETEEYKYANYKIRTCLMGYPDTVEVRLRDANTSFHLTKDTIAPLMDAYCADFEEHYNLEDLSSYFYCVTLDLDFCNAEKDYYYGYLSVPNNYERTLNYLHELYPEYIPFVNSADRIVSITPFISEDDLRKYGSVYNYFALTDHTTSDDISTTEETTSSSVAYGEVIIPESVMAYPSAKEIEFTITDAEMIEELYPYLYLGQYASFFEERDYIFLGDVQTADSRHVDAWVKPGTLPEKYIMMIEEAMQE